MLRSPVAKAVARCRRRQLLALAARAPVLALLLAVAAAATPAGAFFAVSKAKPTLAGLFASPESATLYAIATALVTSLVIATWVARRTSLPERFPTLAVRGRSRLRLFVEAELGLIGPVFAFTILCAAPALASVSTVAPGGGLATITWLASTLTIAGVAGAVIEVVRAKLNPVNVVLLTLTSVSVWVAPAALLGLALAVGPAGVAGSALSGRNVAAAFALNLSAAIIVWAVVVRSLVTVPRRERAASVARRPRRLPRGATRATTVALLREVGRTPRARSTIAVGLVLGIGGPLSISALVPVPAGILLLVGITTTGTSAAILASVAASRAAALAVTTPNARTEVSASLAALTIAVSFTVVSSGALLLLAGGTLGDALIVLKPAIFGVAAAVATARIDLGSDEELEQLRVAIYALLATVLNLASTLLPIPLALALGLAVLAGACLPPRRHRRTVTLPDYVTASPQRSREQSTEFA